jgi:predicted extracellular nuclease
MAYNAKRMKELYHQSIRFKFDNDPEAATRDILYAKMLAKKDTLHFFVNHWPSRRGGQEVSEPKRMKAASVVRSRIDSILVKDPKAKVIIMGDFNDHPNDRSMTEALNCEPGANNGLTNLMYNRHLKGEGSYNYKGEWGMLDQFIVSDALLAATKGYTTVESAAFVFKPDWLLYTEEGKEPSPSKTYGGPNYYGGFSDHLPICIELK